MHDSAIESRTLLQLEKVTEEQAQELEDFKLERKLARSTKRREEQESEVDQEIRLNERREQSELALRQARAETRRQELLIVRDQAELRQSLHNATHRLALNVRNIDQAYAQYEAFLETREAARDNLLQQGAEYG